MASKLASDEQSASAEDASLPEDLSKSASADWASVERAASYRMQKQTKLVRMGTRLRYVDEERGVDKIISFDPSGMLRWTSMFRYYGTVFEFSMVRNMLIATVVLCALVFGATTRMPGALDDDFSTEMLGYMLKFMMTFLAFMVGIFVNGAFQRWQYIVGQLAQLQQQLKMLYMDLVMHNVPRVALHDVRRWGTVSVWLVAVEAPACWDDPKWPELLSEMRDLGLLLEEEREMLLDHCDDKTSLVWVWIVMKLRELSEQQFLPPKNTPALMHTLDRCHMALANIGHIFNAILLQVPFQYMHALALLINLLNIMNTLKCGIDLAIIYCKSTGGYGHWLTLMEVQQIVSHVGIMLLAPLVYQSFINISADIMIPFGDGSVDIPMRFLVQELMAEFNEIDDSISDRVSGAHGSPGSSGTPPRGSRGLSGGSEPSCEIA